MFVIWHKWAIATQETKQSTAFVFVTVIFVTHIIGLWTLRLNSIFMVKSLKILQGHVKVVNWLPSHLVWIFCIQNWRPQKYLTLDINQIITWSQGRNTLLIWNNSITRQLSEILKKISKRSYYTWSTVLFIRLCKFFVTMKKSPSSTWFLNCPEIKQ